MTPTDRPNETLGLVADCASTIHALIDWMREHEPATRIIGVHIDIFDEGIEVHIRGDREDISRIGDALNLQDRKRSVSDQGSIHYYACGVWGGSRITFLAVEFVEEPAS